ncbi:DUF3188 domain-containing protein [Enterococcus sp. JM4C]|uniref:DUF3188 domain-containing protein n=1 Tax=Candidatus Enterococcus huntleyi TaxID=1857217 RepID=UPI00137AAD13|nr:DUF3188 domain-containing protein [Enterococcus sp. JM4C]KAF1297169.1 DUF3188 domain-containing protein [Enterococcus sp. JM4C]
MIKNGLFLCSIGFLIILYSLNPQNLQYDVLSMVTGFTLIGLGIFFFMKGKKKEDLKKKEDGGSK